MLSAAEIIDIAGKTYLNVGDDQLVDDADYRFRAQIGLRRAMARAWTKAPFFFKFNDGQVTISSGAGVGTLPANFGSMGTKGIVYHNGQQLPPLIYASPDILTAWLNASPTSVPFPSHYTLKGKTAAGLAQLSVALLNQGNITLDVKDYAVRSPWPVDKPSGYSAAAGASGTNLNGAYRWRVAWRTADGDTQAGSRTDELTLTTDAATITIPPSPFRDVTFAVIYRTEAGGSQYKLSGTKAAIAGQTIQYADNVADGSLGAAATEDSDAISGTEYFPEDFHETVLLDGLKADLAEKQGDLRDGQFWQKWESEVRRMWADQKPGQAEPKGLPAYAEFIGRRRRRPTLLS